MGHVFKNLNSFSEFNKLFEGKYTILLNKYKEDVKDMIINTLKVDYKMDDLEIEYFMDDFLSMGKKVDDNINSIIEFNYTNNSEPDVCADELIKKYYPIIKMNNSDSMYDSNEEGISEGNYYHYEKVSNSLFWYFIKKLNSIDIKLNLDTLKFDSNTNSFNNKSFLFYIESDSVGKTEVEYEFAHSKLLSNILPNISDRVKFYIGINNSNKLRFGYIVDDKRYTIGNIEYKSSDFKRLSSIINCSDTSISISRLSERFKSNIVFINYYKGIFNTHLGSYIGTDVHVGIIDDKITLMISTDDDDIVNDRYLLNIINENNKYNIKQDSIKIIKKISNGKTYYYISIK